MNNIMPVLEVKARRIGGATYQVPIEVRADRRQALGLRWLVTFSREAKRPWKKDWPTKFSMRRIIPVPLLREKKICTKWQKPTRHSLITGFNLGGKALVA